jgi:hypothetical protein
MGMLTAGCVNWIGTHYILKAAGLKNMKGANGHSQNPTVQVNAHVMHHAFTGSKYLPSISSGGIRIDIKNSVSEYPYYNTSLMSAISRSIPIQQLPSGSQESLNSS